MPDIASDDAALICDLLRAGKTDPNFWTHSERAAVTRLHQLREVDAPAEEPDPKVGAIERLLTDNRFRGYNVINHALNEAYANGLDSGRREISEQVLVHVPGVPYESEDGNQGACDWPATLVADVDPHRDLIAYTLPPHFFAHVKERFTEQPAAVWVVIPGLAQHNVSGGVAERDWFARRRENENAVTLQGTSYPVYEVVGDPNGTAVGRFKASFRKFLGVD